MFDVQLAWDRPKRAGTNNTEHYLRIRLHPAVPAQGQGVAARVALALDTSGSMKGTRLDHARRACLALVRALRPQDQVSLATFATGVNALVSDQRRDAVDLAALEQQLAALVANGVTRTDLALAWLEKVLGDGGGARIAALVTDGSPTNVEGQVLDDVSPLVTAAQRLGQHGVTLNAIGLGSADDFNHVLLADLSSKGLGSFLFAETEGQLEPRLREQVSKGTSVAAPAVTVGIRPRLTGLKVFSCGVIQPVRQTLDFPALKNERHTVCIPNPRGDGDTDLLVRVEVPPKKMFGDRGGSKLALTIEVTPEGGSTVEADASITYVESLVEAQQLDEQVHRARLAWDAWLYQDAINHSTDLTRTADLLESLRKTADMAGMADVASSAQQQIDHLQSTGQVNSTLLARSTTVLQNPGASR